jgi:hypothetical protein
MLFPRRRARVSGATVASFLALLMIVFQQTASAKPPFHRFVHSRVPGASLSCSGLASSNSAAALEDLAPVESLLKLVCESAALDAMTSGVTVHDSAPPQPAAGATTHTRPGLDPCHHANASAVGCTNYEDLVKNDLAALGRDGQKLLAARERVLEILQQPNDCSAWFEQHDADTVETFRTVNFFIDRNGVDYISEVKQRSSSSILFNPYVARAIQEGGSYQTITINAEGAFFQPQAPVREQSREGGPAHLNGAHALSVGPYLGGTMRAQVITLLHELGHLVGLLPHDQGDIAGRSVRNTYEVLKYCRASVESLPKHMTLTFVASR